MVSAQGSEETRMMAQPDGRKSFKIGLTVLIQSWSVTDSQPASQPRRRSKYALCISASRSKNWWFTYTEKNTRENTSKVVMTKPTAMLF